MSTNPTSYTHLVRLAGGRALAAIALALCLGLNAVSSVHAEPAPQQQNAVNINVADAEAIATALKGVGLNKAQDIVRYREQYGPFTTVDQLVEVKGIGEATVANNRNRIALD